MQRTFIRYFLPLVISARRSLFPRIALTAMFLPFRRLTPVEATAPGFEIEGTMLDSTGAAVGGAEAVLRPMAGAGEWRARSGSEGRFVIHSVPDGQYSIHVIAAGFSKAE